MPGRCSGRLSRDNHRHIPGIQAGFTIIPVEKACPSAKNPGEPSLIPEEQNLALRPSNPANRPASAVTRDEAQQEGFMREVDEALRQDEAIDMMRRYGKPIGIAIAVGLALFAAWLGWENYRHGQREERAEKYITALDELQAENLDKANGLLAPLAKDGDEGSKAAAAMLRAGISAEQNRLAEAATQFGQVAADEKAPQPFRDLARIREISLRFDTLKPDQVVSALKPLAVPGKPWFGSAGELVAMAYVKQGRNDLAGPLFAAISRDKSVPDSIRARTRQMAGLLGVDAIDDVNQAVADTSAGAAAAGQ